MYNINYINSTLFKVSYRVVTVGGVLQAGKRLWKGLRVSCKFLWSGLVLYTKPFSSMDFNEARVWEERHEAEACRQRGRLDCCI